MITQDEIEMDASQNSTELPPAVASTSGGYPPAIPSTSRTEITGGRVEIDTSSSTRKRKLQDDTPQKIKKMVSHLKYI